MCFFCVEIQKEKLTGSQVAKLVGELFLSGDFEHIDKLNKVLEDSSEVYKQKLNKEANEELLLDDPDPFDPWP